MFKESRNKDEAGRCLAEYATAVEQGGGALLFAIIGGKMSEGSVGRMSLLFFHYITYVCTYKIPLQE